MPVGGTQVPSSPLVAGTSARSGAILQGYVFQSGIHEPEVENILSYKYPQYYATAMLDRLGFSQEVEQDTYTWFIQDRTRKSGTISAVANNTLATATFEVDEFAYSTAAPGYAVVGDLYRLDAGQLALVTAVGQGVSDTGAQKLTVQRPSGDVWTAAILADTGKIGHVGNAFVEASDAPLGRSYLPDEDYNYTQILRRSFKISGSEFGNKTWLNDGKSWFFEMENIEMKEFARDKELIALFGERASSGNMKFTEGMFVAANTHGVKNGFAASSGVAESDIQEQIADLVVEGGSDDLLVLCGVTFMKDFNIAMRDYYTGGGVSFGGFEGTTIGLDTQNYNFMGKTIRMKHYPLFDDTAALPYASTATATKYNFKNTSFWMDLGQDDRGQQIVSLVYKKGRKMIHGIEPGMTSPDGNHGGVVSNGGDYFSIHYICDFGVKVVIPNRLGILRATS